MSDCEDFMGPVSAGHDLDKKGRCRRCGERPELSGDERRERCTCGETACESDLCDCDAAPCPVDHAAEHRRERYYKAMVEAEHQAGSPLLVHKVDAAMAVADEEIRAAKLEGAQIVAANYVAERSRLRAELEDARESLRDANREIADCKVLEYEATISRVRAVLETESVLNRTALEYRGLVCKAVYGAPDASS